MTLQTSGPNLGLLIGGDEGDEHYVELLRQWRGFDLLIQPRVLDKDLNAPPGSPADGAAYIISGSPTGAWAGKAGQLTRYSTVAAAWEFYVPKAGWEAYVQDEAVKYRFDGSAWAAVGSGSSGGGSTGSTVTTLTNSGGTVNIDCSLGDYFKLTLSANVTSITFSNLPGAGKGASKFVEIVQTGAYTVAWPASFKWQGGTAGAVSTTGATDELAITTVDNGLTWKATLGKAWA